MFRTLSSLSHSIVKYGNKSTIQNGVSNKGLLQCLGLEIQNTRQDSECGPVFKFEVQKKTRVLGQENLTARNTEFIKSVVHDGMNSPLLIDEMERGEWHPRSFRCGLIGRHIGTHIMWTTGGKQILSTLIQIIDNQVIKYIPPDANPVNERLLHPVKWNRAKRFGSLVVGAENGDPTKFRKEYMGLFQESGVWPKRILTKFLVTPNAVLPSGQPLYASHFRPGDHIDVSAITITRGFQGVMTRFGFKGMPKTHGVTKSHRKGGNTGGGVGKKDGQWRGTKIPGFMGNRRRMQRGIKVIRLNTKYNVLWLNGTIPGATNSIVYLYDSLLPKHIQNKDNHRPFPTFYQAEEEIEEDIMTNDIHNFKSPSISFDSSAKE